MVGVSVCAGAGEVDVNESEPAIDWERDAPVGVQEMGKKAFNLLMEHMEAKSKLAYSKVVIKSQFEIRKSVRRI